MPANAAGRKAWRAFPRRRRPKVALDGQTHGRAS
jgi:hypothetical protein